MAELSAQERSWARLAQRGSEYFRLNFDGPGDAGDAYSFYSKIDPDGDYSFGKGTSRRSSRGGDGVIDKTAGVLGKGVQWGQEAISAGHETNLKMVREREFINMGDMLDVLVNESGKLRGPLDMVGKLAETAAMGLIDNFRMQNFLLEEMNQRTGMLGDTSREFREEITDAYPSAIRLGITFDELTESVVSLVEQSGKFKLLSSDTIKEMALASAFAEDMIEYAKMGVEFEKVSMGIYDMTQATNKAGKDAMAIGLNARTTVSEISKNLELLNQYGFQRGVDGLSEMVQKSIEFRTNIMDTARIADKVWEPQGALDLVANMQVIGGAIGDFNDPLKLMYMATNNIEGLQDALLDASKALVTYNSEQGRFEVTGANLRRAKAMADELGMSMADLTKTAVASMERTQAASELMSQGLNINEKDREFLINMSQMKDGRMTIEIPESMASELGLEETSVALGDMSDELAGELVRRREQLRDKTMEEINREQVSLIANIGRQVSYIGALLRTQAGDLGVKLARDLGFDPLNMQNQFADMIDKKIAPHIDSEFAEEGVKSLKPYQNIKSRTNPAEPMEVKENTTETKNTETTAPTKHEMVVTYKAGDNVANKFVRLLWNDPYFQSQQKDSFLEMWGK